MNAAIAYWTDAAREQSRWYVQLRREYRATKHAHKRARLWAAGNRCRDRIRPFMAEARRVAAQLAAQVET